MFHGYPDGRRRRFLCGPLRTFERRGRVPDALRERLGGWATALKVLITVVVLVLLFNRVDPRQVIGNWGGIGASRFLVALFLVVPNLACQYGRLRVGLARAHPAADGKSSLRALIVGLAMGAITPGS